MVASTVCVMDATTILGRRVNEGESAWTTQDLVNGEAPSLWQGEIKNQKKLCKHSCRHPKGPVDRGWRSSPGPAKKAQCVVQNCQNGLRKRSTRRPTCPLGRPVDRVWMGAAQGLRKGPCGGVKSPKTGCTSAALDVSMVVTSHHHGYIHVRQGGCNQPIWLQPSTWFQTTDLTPIGPTSPSLSGPYAVRASHDYDEDRIHIRTEDSEAVICNDESEAREEEPETAEETRERDTHLHHGQHPSQNPRNRAQRPKPRPSEAVHAMMEEERHETDPGEQLREEWARINMLRALEGPWAETRFAEYLTVEAGTETDEQACEEGTTGIGAKAQHPTTSEGSTPCKHRAAEQRLWAETIRDTQLINQITSHWQPSQRVNESATARRKTEGHPIRRAIRPQFLGTDLKDASRAQVQARLTSEVQIRRLQAKLDEMRTMAYPGIDTDSDQGMRPGDAAVNAMGDVSAEEFRIDRGTNTSARAVDPFSEQRVQEILSKIQIGADLMDDQRAKVVALIREYQSTSSLPTTRYPALKSLRQTAVRSAWELSSIVPLNLRRVFPRALLLVPGAMGNLRPKTDTKRSAIGGASIEESGYSYENIRVGSGGIVHEDRQGLWCLKTEAGR
ncbi:hypothetical protein B0H14DRAFT_3592230 [Mycena olivaceomarginata]|nr:hypothetical protein B0H14DRAFT_3592230 [Mycena olivaceomarginata]